MNVIIDASVAIKCFFPEEYTAQAQRVIGGPDAFHAPETLLLEFDSVLCRRIRRKDSTLADAEEARVLIRRRAITLHPIGGLLDPAFLLAAKTDCTPYDCLYVVLAAQLGGKMVTADERLCHNLASSPFAENLLWIGDVK